LKPAWMLRLPLPPRARARVRTPAQRKKTPQPER
jgi:hypothetical protein